MLTKCKDKEGKIPLCKYVSDPKAQGVLTSKDMAFLGYITCPLDGETYLANADRNCEKYAN